MSLFQCECCGCVENTALSLQGTKGIADWFDWTGIEDRRGLLLCSACGPTKNDDGSPTKLGKWHCEFKRTFLPMAQFKANREGNLEHIETGSTDYRSFEIHIPDVVVAGAGMQTLASKIAQVLATTAMCMPYYLNPPITHRNRLSGKPIKPPQKTEADFRAIEKAKSERERKGKKRLKSFARHQAR